MLGKSEFLLKMSIVHLKLPEYYGTPAGLLLLDENLKVMYMQTFEWYVDISFGNRAFI